MIGKKINNKIMKTIYHILKRLVADGGVTFNPFWMDDDGSYIEPTGGYAIAQGKHTFTVKYQDPVDPIIVEQALSNFIVKNAERLESKRTYVGLWLEGDNLHIDLSKVILEPDKAYLEGYRQGQKAIYDLERPAVVYLINPQTCGTESQKKAYKVQCADNFKKSRS